MRIEIYVPIYLLIDNDDLMVYGFCGPQKTKVVAFRTKCNFYVPTSIIDICILSNQINLTIFVQNLHSKKEIIFQI